MWVDPTIQALLEVAKGSGGGGGGMSIDDIATGTYSPTSIDIGDVLLCPYAFAGTNITKVFYRIGDGQGPLAGMSGAFRDCLSLTAFVMPLTTYVIATSSSDWFNGCTNLAAFDSSLSAIQGARCFNNCSRLTTLVLRGSSIVNLSNATFFNGTPFANGGTGGTIYIPKALYDHLEDGTSNDYKAATNWATLDAYGTITWAKIEGSIYETQYADGTPIT